MGLGIVLAAGGQGTRFGGVLPKQFLEVRPGKPLLRYALDTFHGLPEVEAISLVLPPDRLEAWRNLLEMFRTLTPANDLEFRYGTNAPTLRVEGLTVAGQ